MTIPISLQTPQHIVDMSISDIVWIATRVAEPPAGISGVIRMLHHTLTPQSSRTPPWWAFSVVDVILEANRACPVGGTIRWADGKFVAERSCRLSADEATIRGMRVGVADPTEHIVIADACLSMAIAKMMLIRWGWCTIMYVAKDDPTQMYCHLKNGAGANIATILNNESGWRRYG